jgi:hypothetical protein
MENPKQNKKKILVICSRISNSDGVGRIALSIIDVLKKNNLDVKVFTIDKNSFIGKLQELCIKFYLRNIFDLIFCFFVDILLLTKYRSYLSISPSVITGLLTRQTHFSSCHLHSLLMIKESWKLLDPRNLYYVIHEAIHYKFCKQAIFISEQERQQFYKYYGSRKNLSKVVYPVLSSINFKTGHVDKNFGQNLNYHSKKNILFIGYNFRMKGLDIAIETVRNDSSYNLDIIGSDKRYKQQMPNENANVTFLGNYNFKDIKWSNYSFFLFPSYSDAYALVAQEATRNGLIPIVSSQTGASEVFIDNKLEHCVVQQKQNNNENISMDYLSRLRFFYETFTKKQIRKYEFNSRELYNHEDYGDKLIKILLPNT